MTQEELGKKWGIRKAEIIQEKREQERETEVTLTNGRMITMNKNNLCYCILTVQYIKCYCVAGTR